MCAASIFCARHDGAETAFGAPTLADAMGTVSGARRREAAPGRLTRHRRVRNETTGETTRPETTVAVDWLGRGDPITVTTSVYDDNTWELLEEETERIEPPAENETRTQVR